MSVARYLVSEPLLSVWDTTRDRFNKGLKYGCSQSLLTPSQPVISLTLSSLHYQGALERLLRAKLYIHIYMYMHLTLEV